MSSERCQSTVELSTLAAGMAKQHERYQDALQELLDNAVSSVVEDETYFEDPAQPVELVVTLVRDSETVKTIVADNGPGISKHELKNDVFRTGNKRVSDGILNNVGWGLKASISWFERTLKQHDVDQQKSWFTLVTQTEQGSPLRVDGPIVGDLPIREGDGAGWEIGVDDDPLATYDHGTRVHVSCSRTQFDTDVWPSATALETKTQFLRERLGVLFRRLLTAHDDNRITLNYHDLETGERGSVDVVPITPIYEEAEAEAGTHDSDEFTVTDADGNVYDVQYERGTLDFGAMTDAVGDDHPGLLTSSGRFRYRYRPSQNRQGVDIYANGRVLMTSVFSDLFDLTRNNQYNYWGGTVRISPQNATVEVPTDNKKTRIDTNSALWQAIKDELSATSMQPQGKDYTGTAIGNTLSGTDVEHPQQQLAEASSEDPSSANDATASESASFDPEPDSLYGLHNHDAKHLRDTVAAATDEEQSEIVDVAITSPPYFDLKDYGYDDDLQIGQNESYGEYLEQLRSVFRQLYDVTSSTGTLWVVINSFRRQSRVVQLPSDIARICQSLHRTDTCPHCSSRALEVPLEYDEFSGMAVCRNCEYEIDQRDNSWILRDRLIWDKGRALPYVEDGELRNVYEHVLCFSKSEEFSFDQDRARLSDPVEFEKWWVDYPERYNPRGKLQDNIWRIDSPDRGGFNRDTAAHPAALPPELAERIVELTTEPGDVVMDPFAGSGSMLAQATAMDRRAIGFELNEAFCDRYPDLKETIQERYSDQDDRLSERQQRLAKLMASLRQVKYARTHLRQVAQRVNVPVPNDLDVHTVFLVSRSAGDIEPGDSYGQADLLYVIDDGAAGEEAGTYAAAASEVTTEPPLSKYGLEIQTAVETTSAAISLLSEGEFSHPTDHLYLYRDGRHYVFEDQLPIEEWMEYMADRERWREEYARFNCPPILSNLRLDVNHPRHSLETMDRVQSENHDAAMFDATDTPVFDISISDTR